MFLCNVKKWWQQAPREAAEIVFMQEFSHFLLKMQRTIDANHGGSNRVIQDGRSGRQHMQQLC